MIDQADFMKTTSAHAEAHIRAYDTKAEILLAAVALSFDPLSRGIERVGFEALRDFAFLVQFAFFMIVLVLLAWVLAPIRAAASDSSRYVKSPESMTPADYISRVGKSDLADELAADVLRLGVIRNIKHTRFNHALRTLVFYFVAVLFYGLTGFVRLSHHW